MGCCSSLLVPATIATGLLLGSLRFLLAFDVWFPSVAILLAASCDFSLVFHMCFTKRSRRIRTVGPVTPIVDIGHIG